MYAACNANNIDTSFIIMQRISAHIRQISHWKIIEEYWNIEKSAIELQWYSTKVNNNYLMLLIMIIIIITILYLETIILKAVILMTVNIISNYSNKVKKSATADTP